MFHFLALFMWLICSGLRATQSISNAKDWATKGPGSFSSAKIK